MKIVWAFNGKTFSALKIISDKICQASAIEAVKGLEI